MAPSENDRKQWLLVDYEKTVEYFNLLSDIRFKLLAFVPTLAGVAVALVSSDKVSPPTAFALSILGFVVTVGIIMYELRNTLFYQMSAARAAFLESELVPEKSDQKNPKLRGGMFTERESMSENPQKLVGIIPIAHGVGLAFIYGASLGGWVYIFVYSLFPKSEMYVSLIIAVIVSVFTAILFGITAYQAHKRAQMAPLVTHV